jgi:hypothetical protein
MVCILLIMLPIMMLPLHLLLLKQVPAGTPLHVRLTTAVGTYASKSGTQVSAVLIAPVVADNDTLIPAGSTLAGTVTKVKRVGFGIVHETATLALDFDRIILPDGGMLPISTRLRQVDNGREKVARDGNILGVRATSSISYRVSGYIRTLICNEVHMHLVSLAFRMLFVQVPEPEIYYPPGSELTLALTDSMLAEPRPDAIDTTELTHQERADLERVIADLPIRAYSRKTNAPSDLINMLFVGTREQVSAAFIAAGWTETKPVSMRARITGLRAVAEVRPFLAAPMSTLLVNDAVPDLSWQKGLNDFSKRHHIRMWKQPELWNGQEVWAAAATRDIDYAYMRPGHMFTHQIEEDVDRERDKIAHDLEFTACTDAVDFWERPGFPRLSYNATGDLMTSDARLAVIRLNGCGSPHLSDDPNAPRLAAHGGKWQRLARRQILSVRNDFYRRNMYWRGYEATRWTVSLIRKHRQPAGSPSPNFDTSEPVASSFFSKVRNSSWLR